MVNNKMHLDNGVTPSEFPSAIVSAVRAGEDGRIKKGSWQDCRECKY